MWLQAVNGRIYSMEHKGKSQQAYNSCEWNFRRTWLCYFCWAICFFIFRGVTSCGTFWDFPVANGSLVTNRVPTTYNTETNKFSSHFSLPPQEILGYLLREDRMSYDLDETKENSSAGFPGSMPSTMGSDMLDGKIVNVKVTREVRILRDQVIVFIDVLFRALESSNPAARAMEYIVLLPTHEAVQLRSFLAMQDFNDSLVVESLTPINLNEIRSAMKNDDIIQPYSVYVVHLSHPAPAEGTSRLLLSYSLGRPYVPLPRYINPVREQQLLLFETFSKWPSVYLTLVESSKFKLTDSPLVEESASELEKELERIKGDSTIYLSKRIINSKPLSAGKLLKFHFINNSPLLYFPDVVVKATVSSERIYYIEEYKIHNDAASIESDFSRNWFESFPRNRNLEPHSVQTIGNTLYAEFPLHARDFEFYDRIGSIYGSQMHSEGGKQLPSEKYVKLVPRYPLVGGWDASWKISFSVPSSDYMTKVSFFSYKMKLPLACTLMGPHPEEFRMNIKLPAGSYGIKVLRTDSFRVSEISHEFSVYSNFLPSPVIRLESPVGSTKPMFAPLNQSVEIVFQNIFIAEYLQLFPCILIFLIVWILWMKLRALNFRILSPKEQLEITMQNKKRKLAASLMRCYSEFMEKYQKLYKRLGTQESVEKSYAIDSFWEKHANSLQLAISDAAMLYSEEKEIQRLPGLMLLLLENLKLLLEKYEDTRSDTGTKLSDSLKKFTMYEEKFIDTLSQFYTGNLQDIKH